MYPVCAHAPDIVGIHSFLYFYFSSVHAIMGLDKLNLATELIQPIQASVWPLLSGKKRVLNGYA